MHTGVCAGVCTLGWLELSEDINLYPGFCVPHVCCRVIKNQPCPEFDCIPGHSCCASAKRPDRFQQGWVQWGEASSPLIPSSQFLREEKKKTDSNHPRKKKKITYSITVYLYLAKSLHLLLEYFLPYLSIILQIPLLKGQKDKKMFYLLDRDILPRNQALWNYLSKGKT